MNIIHEAMPSLHSRIRPLQGPKSGSRRRLHDLQLQYSCTQNRRGAECGAYHLGLLVRALGCESITPHSLPNNSPSHVEVDNDNGGSRWQRHVCSFLRRSVGM